MAENFPDQLAAAKARVAEIKQNEANWDAQYARLLKGQSDATTEEVETRRIGALLEARIAEKQATPTTPTNPSNPSTPGAGTDGLMPYAVFKADGTVDTAKYAAVAQSMGTVAGVDYLMGPGPSFYGTDTDADKPLLVKQIDHSGDEFSKALNPSARYARGCTLGFCGSWQLGGPVHPNEAGMYSSNMGQKLFVPDNRNISVEGQVGVLTDITFECGANTATTKSELPWHYGGRGMTAINVKRYGTEGKDISYPCAIGRGEGRPGWNNNNLIATRGGLIMGDGQNTSSNRLTTQLRAGLVPTGLHQSNSNEFAFVTCWSPSDQKGYLAVLALAGTPQNGYLGTDPAGWENYRGELRGCFPGVPNYGNLSFAKVVGYIDLGIRCPSAVACSTFHFWGNYQQMQDNDLDNNGKGWDFRREDHRARFRKGGPRYSAWPKRMMVCVLSKEEKKAVYIDFTAMLRYYRETYTSSGGVGTVGMGANQFPLTFDENATQKPVIVRTETFTDRPTCVRMSRFDRNPRVYIGFQPGYISIVNPGAYPNEDSGVWNGSQIAEVGRVACGRNPTWIATVIRHMGAGGREGGSGDDSYFGKRVYPLADFAREIIVCCRGDRCIDWVRFNEAYTTGAIERRLKDKRLKDPTWVEDNENHTTEHYEVTITDFAGRQIYSARYGNLIFWNNEGVMGDDPNNPIYYDWDVGLPPDGFTIAPTTGPDGKVYKFECGGQMEVPGFPFAGGTANVF